LINQDTTENKHSTYSQYNNEKGLNVDELQMITDHARRGSVLKYADVQIDAKRRLMERKILEFPGDIRETDPTSNKSL
jgi:hypothetical protein